MDGFLITADHDPFSRNSLARFFSENGFRVAAISNGRECITELAVRGPDVLVIALEVSRGGGAGVIARLNGNLPPPQQTACCHRQRVRAKPVCAHGGAAPDCSSKPVRRAELLSRIPAAFSGRLRPGDGNGRTPPGKMITRARVEEGIE